jgi:hypothetical protein
MEGAFATERPSQIRKAGAKFRFSRQPVRVIAVGREPARFCVAASWRSAWKAIALRQEVATSRDAVRYLSPATSGRRFVRLRRCRDGWSILRAKRRQTRRVPESSSIFRRAAKRQSLRKQNVPLGRPLRRHHHPILPCSREYRLLPGRS